MTASRDTSSATASPALPTANHVVVGTRGDRATDAAIRVAVAFAARQHASIEALALVPPISPQIMAQGVTFEDGEGACCDALRGSLTDQLTRTNAGHIPFSVMTGFPAELIADHAVAQRASLVVLGGEHHSLLDRLSGVEVGMAVHRKIAIPILTVAPDASTTMDTIVIGTDFSAAAHRAAILAMAFASDGATIHIVHASSWPDSPAAELDTWSTVYHAGVTQLFEELRDQLPAPQRARIVTHDVHGRPAHAIEDIARAQYADLVAVGTHRGGLRDRLMIGSTAEAVMRSATSSVLVVP